MYKNNIHLTCMNYNYYYYSNKINMENFKEIMKKDDVDFYTILMSTCINGNYEVAKYVIDKHPELLKKVDYTGHTPLSLACYYCYNYLHVQNQMGEQFDNRYNIIKLFVNNRNSNVYHKIIDDRDNKSKKIEDIVLYYYSSKIVKVYKNQIKRIYNLFQKRKAYLYLVLRNTNYFLPDDVIRFIIEEFIYL